MTVWNLGIGLDYCSYEELKQRKVIAQGWPDIDLTTLKPIKDSQLFVDVVNELDKVIYKPRQKELKSGRTMQNLLSIKEGDAVVCCEGIKTKGIAVITKPVKYFFYNNKTNIVYFEYANTVGPIGKDQWIDLTEEESKNIGVGAQGVPGITKCHESRKKVIEICKNHGFQVNE